MISGQQSATNVSVLLQFPGTYYWYYASPGLYENAFNLTIAAALNYGLAVNYSSSSYGIYVNAFGNLWNSNSTSGNGPYWLLWIWNWSQKSWSLSSLGVSEVNLTSSISVAWTYSLWNIASGSPYYAPTQTPIDPFAVTSSRGSPDGSAFNPAYVNTQLQPPSAHLSWRSNTALGGLDTQPVDSGGIAYFVSDGTNGTSSVLAYNKYGVQIWNQSIGSQDYEVASPLAADGQLIIPSTDGNLYSLSLTTGTLLYAVRHVSSAADGLTSAPVLGPTGFFLLNCSGGVDYFSFNGSLIWSSTLIGGSNFTSPAFSDGILYLFSQNGNRSILETLNATSGSSIWNETMGGVVFGTPSVAGGRLFFITSSRVSAGYDNITVHSLLLQSRSFTWNYSAGSSPGAPSSTSAADGRVVFASGNHIFELNSSNGAIVWLRVDNNQYASPSPFIFRNNIFYSTNSNNSELSVVSMSGVPLWNYTAKVGNDYSLSSPIFNGTTVMWGDDMGNIYSFQSLQVVNFTYSQHMGTVNLTAELPRGITNATITWNVANRPATGPADSVSFGSNGTYPVTITVSYSSGTVASVSGSVFVDSVQANSTSTARVQQNSNLLQFLEYGAAAVTVIVIALTTFVLYRRRKGK